VIALAQREGQRRHRVIGIYPETKHPTYFQSIGLSLEEPLVRILDAAGLGDRHDAVFIQSFEVHNLQKLDRMTRLPLIQLIDAAGAPFDFVVAGDPRTYADLVTPARAPSLVVIAHPCPARGSRRRRGSGQRVAERQIDSLRHPVLRIHFVPGVCAGQARPPHHDIQAGLMRDRARRDRAPGQLCAPPRSG
jgi:hypothetical protein